MLHPVGSRPPSVYWRRRLLLLSAVAVLIVLTAWVLRPANGSKANANTAGAGHSSSSNAAVTTSTPQATPTSTGSVAHTPNAATSTPTGAARSGTTASGTTAASPTACVPTQLKIAAAVASPRYNVGDQPQLLLQVTNMGPAACVQDLADSQVELRVYNGESRVWGSHDCEIQPGTADRTLLVGQPVRVSIIWSGLSSEPKCAGTRQRVGAGTYTLYALLSGQTGTAAQFLIS